MAEIQHFFKGIVFIGAPCIYNTVFSITGDKKIWMQQKVGELLLTIPQGMVYPQYFFSTQCISTKTTIP